MQQDRRRSHRFAALAGRDVALLRVGDNDLAVKLQNESSSGFAVQCPPGPKFQVGDALHLRTVSGWFEVKAARVEKTAEGTLLGLDRGREIGHLAGPRQRVPWIGVVSAVGLGLLAIPAVSMLLASGRPGQAAAVISPETVEKPSDPRTGKPAPSPARRP
jgi:hypothetical protein